MVFFVIWWVVLFMILPVGVSVDEAPKKGFATGTPKDPNMKKKFLITTLLTTIIWAIIQIIMVNHWVVLSE
jgi:predicted secreted protein